MIKYILFAFTLLAGVSSAQVNQGINTDQDQQLFSSFYDSIIGSNLKIYTGKKFSEPLSKELIEGNLYFVDDEWSDGTLGYQGQVYRHITMRYHTFIDKLILLKPAGHEGIEVLGINVDFFTLHNTRFEWLTLPREGYYAILYKGNISIFSRHYSTRHDKVSNKNMVTELVAKQKYFITKNGKVTQVKSKRSVLKALIEHKSELRKFLRQQKVTFIQNREIALQALGQEFDRLQNQK